MRTLVLDDDWGKWKFGDTDAVMSFTPKTDDKTPNFANNVLTFKVAESINRVNGDYIASAPGHVSTNNADVLLNTSDLSQLEPGTYAVELWITDSITRKTQIYPSDGYCFFTIDQNTMAVTDISNISTKTLEAVYADLLQKINNFKQGAAGKDGKTPKIIAGTVTKLSPDAQPTFLLTPTADDPNTYQIDLGLPTGAKGDKGDSVQGPQGAPGEDGTTPHIDKATGDWFVGSLDTQVKAQGPEAPMPDMSKYVTVDSLNQQLTTMNDAIKKRPTIDALQAVSDQNGKTLTKLNSLIDSLNASKIRSSNEDLLSKAIIFNGNQYDALNYNNGELVKTAGDLSHNSGIEVLVDADTSTDQYIKIVYGYHGLANGVDGIGAFLGDESFNIKTSLGSVKSADTAMIVTAHITPRVFTNYGINKNQFTIIIGGKASVIYVKEIQVSTLPIEKTLPNALAHLHNYIGEPDEKFYGQNVNNFDTATKATVDGLTLGTSGIGYTGDDGRLKTIQAYVPEQKTYTFVVGKIDQNNLLVSGRTFELPLGKGFNGVDMTGYNIKVNNGEMLFMDLSEAGVYAPDGNHPKYLNTKLRDGSHPSTKAGYTGQMFYDANYLVPFSYSVATKNLPQQISTLEEELTATKDQLVKEKAKKLDVITSPNGKSYRLVVGDNGSLSAISTTPSNVTIFGNSLTYEHGKIGMAASDSNHDWYHYVTDYIKSKNANVKINDRTNMSIWESATSTADREKVFNDNIKPLLSADTELVIIQLGDNVNTAEKKATFAHDTGELLQQIHTVSPKAQVYWIYGWFGNYPEIFMPIQTACDGNGAIVIDIHDLNKSGNTSYVGATRTGLDGSTWQITNPGEAAHPGDKGMKAIADRVISNFDF